MLNRFLDVFSSLNSHKVKYLVIGGIAAIAIFRDRLRVDVQTATPGLIFADAWPRRSQMTYEGLVFHVASRSDLIASKRAAGRSIDLEDVRSLEAG